MDETGTDKRVESPRVPGAKPAPADGADGMVSSAPGRHEASPLARYARDWLRPEAQIWYAESRQRGTYRHYDKEQARVGRWLRLCEPGAVVLDLPCGTGRFSGLVAECGHRLIRADLSYQMVAHARQLGPNGHVLGDLCCDLGRAPLGAGSVDVVMVWRLFHHLRTRADRETLLGQARRLARRYVILSYYNRASATYWAGRLARAATFRERKFKGAIWTKELLDIAGRVGLEPVDIYHYRRGISVNSAVCFRVKSSQ